MALCGRWPGESLPTQPLGRLVTDDNCAAENCENETSVLDNVSGRLTMGALKALPRCALGGDLTAARTAAVCSA